MKLMTDIQEVQINEQLEERGLYLKRIYRSFEGDIRVIASFSSHGYEFRYTVDFDGDYPKLKEVF